MIHEAQDLLQDVAQRYRSEQRSSLGSPHELPHVHFLYEGSEGEQIADSIRSFAHLEDFSPLLAVLDVPSQRAYCHPSDKLSTDVVERLIADFKADKLPFHKLKH
ncbi:hypothetical protein LSAT2_032263 [Lamellibrachia satsuma]|nr:hypothetical protein LSAT2_032263 [Lamellibrachia satsuma]